MNHPKTENLPAEQQSRLRNGLVTASPLFIMALGWLAANASISLFGQWAWAGAFPVYWGSMAIIVFAISGRSKLAGWYGRSKGSLFWPILAILVGLSSFPLLLLPNIAFLSSPFLGLLWFIFALINGNVEEFYWRGFLFSEIKGWSKGYVWAYSTILFIANHFLMMGTLSSALFNLPFLIILIFLSIILALLYVRTGSLRWPVFAHILNDLGNLNIFVFMNLIKLF